MRGSSETEGANGSKDISHWSYLDPIGLDLGTVSGRGLPLAEYGMILLAGLTSIGLRQFQN